MVAFRVWDDTIKRQSPSSRQQMPDDSRVIRSRVYLVLIIASYRSDAMYIYVHLTVHYADFSLANMRDVSQVPEFVVLCEVEWLEECAGLVVQMRHGDVVRWR